MAELVQIVRRHEQTMKGKDGKKLDKPTPEGVAAAYKRGIDLREQYPDHEFRGQYSDKMRTRIALDAWLHGADASDASRYVDKSLNPPGLDKDVLDKIRNTDDVTAQRELLYNQGTDEVTRAGAACAFWIFNNLNKYFETKEPLDDRVEIKISSAPNVEAAYLIMRDIPVTFDNVRDYAGFCEEGHGFDVISNQNTAQIELVNQHGSEILDFSVVEKGYENAVKYLTRDKG
ncbi:hypothetical protein ACFL96_10050 [Thermoproteota archaeon]